MSQRVRSFVSLSASALLLFTTLLFTTASVSQTTDEIHVAPPVREETPKPPADAIAVRLKALRVNVDLVRVPVMVTDTHGSPVMDLNKKDFELVEGSNEQRIDYFYAEDAPISVGLVVDVSGSMGEKMDRVRQAVDAFFEHADPKDDYFVLTFANDVKLLADTTRSPETIKAKLGGMKAKGGTSLADAIYVGLEKLKFAAYSRKALVVISDGGDNMSRHNLWTVKRRAKESDAQIYAIAVCDAPSILFTKKLQERFGRRWLTQVSEVTGGRMIEVDTSAQIPDAASRISYELRNQYVLGYRPADLAKNGKWRKIKVRVTRPPGPLAFQVYHRTGYMARKEEREQ